MATTALTTDDEHPMILLVEDEFLLSDMLAEALAEHGFEVRAAANAKDAIEYLTRGRPCDVLLTDINLPGGIDGTELAQRARALWPYLQVVYVSGSVSRIEEFAAVPRATFVAKPYDPKRLCVILTEMTQARH